nr:MAG TPA: hypothetical protein [Bacteriophage sp.]
MLDQQRDSKTSTHSKIQKETRFSCLGKHPHGS